MARVKQNLKKMTKQEHEALFQKKISPETLGAIISEFNYVLMQLASVELLAHGAPQNDCDGAKERVKQRRQIKDWLKKLGLSNESILIIQLGAKAKVENDLKA